MLYAVSRIPTNNTPLSVYSTHTLYQTKHPSHLEHNLEAEVPSRGLHIKHQLPDSIRLSVTRVLTPIGYIALQFDSGGGAQSRAFVFVSCLRLSLALGLVSVSSLSLVVCLGDDNASSVVRRNNDRARASASLVSSLSPLSHLKREGARSLVSFGCMSSNYGSRPKISSYREAPIKLSDPLSIIVSRSVVEFDEFI